ncbi:ATP-binding protein [Mesohalobacter halotolerans]|uniref:ATP-binding protein n=1 Tax=Mesohalobacter halotolerans TaxID=1883405 RepID=A0A4U5TRE3_9FLAO|nr:ATP-binding protein [Mesohalobacter halotolerans]TKS56819.1 ATP-binding protein [Mesohalobacter halotolerans]
MNQLQRHIAPKILEALQKFPIIGIMGPRQSGKTTLCQMLKPTYTYVNLEDISLRSFAKNDPKGFLETYKNGVIIDEIQYVPELFSYLQVYTDQRQINGEYLITGSQHFSLSQHISQSLAGRISLFHLLPLSLTELKQGHYNCDNWEDYVVNGAYPRKWINDIDPVEYYGNYLNTYIERDVRMLKNIMNLDLFQKFIKLLAGRIGQLFNQSSLGNELGLDNKTINSWMSLLEASFIAFRLSPYHTNFNKRIVKTPKVYFYDTGLLAYLLGIRSAEDVKVHFAKGQLFENFIILEKVKSTFNYKTHESYYFWRDSSGNEVDLLIEDGTKLQAVEIKSSKTIHTDFFKNLKQFSKVKSSVIPFLVYGGHEYQKRTNGTVLGFKQLNRM